MATLTEIVFDPQAGLGMVLGQKLEVGCPCDEQEAEACACECRPLT